MSGGGVFFNYNGKFNKAINKQAKQGMRAFYGLLSKVRKLRLPVELSFELFDYLVLPVFLYGCEVWGYSNINQLEVLHKKFLKIILGLSTVTPDCMIFGETGRRNIRSIIDSRMISFYARMINGKHSKLSYIMFQLAKKKCVVEKGVWLFYASSSTPALLPPAQSTSGGKLDRVPA